MIHSRKLKPKNLREHLNELATRQDICKFCRAVCYWIEVEEGKWRLYDAGTQNKHTCTEKTRVSAMIDFGL